MEVEDNVNFRSLFIPFTTLKAIICIFLIGISVFFNGLFNNFVGDDLGQLSASSQFHSFFSVISYYTGIGSNGFSSIYFRPFPPILFSSFYMLFGQNYFIFHFYQIFLHILNATVLFLFFKNIFKKSLAFILAVLFLVHPINSEVAFAISYSQETLFFFFGILSLWVLQKSGSKKLLLLSNPLLFCSYLSKETGLLFLFAAIIYSYLFKRKFFIPMLLFSITTLGIYFILRINAVGLFAKTSVSPIASLPVYERLINVPSIFLFYLKTFIYPLTLSSSYQWIYTKMNFQHFYFPVLIDVLFIGILSLVFYVLFKKKTNRSKPNSSLIFAFFAFWFFIGIIFHSQILPLDQTVAERWFYFPIVGILGMIGVILETFVAKKYLKIVLGFMFIVLCLFSIKTISRSLDWRNEFSIASHDIKVSPDAWGLENELSYAYFEKGEYDKAREHAQKSIKLYPYKTNYINLAASSFYLGDYRGARDAYLESLKYGQSAQTYESLSYLALGYGDPLQNIDFIKNTAIKKFPLDAKLWLYLAVLEYNFGNKDNAISDVKKAYLYDQNSLQIIGVYNAIMNNKPVKIDIGKK